MAAGRRRMTRHATPRHRKIFSKFWAKTKRPKAFFETLNKANIYAIVYRLQTAKKPETRARRIAEYVAMLERGETLHGPVKKSQ